jgi:hypothetical protein
MFAYGQFTPKRSAWEVWPRETATATVEDLGRPRTVDGQSRTENFYFLLNRAGSSRE